MTEERFTYLFNKQLKGHCSELEYREYVRLLNSGKYDHIASALMDNQWILSREAQMDAKAAENILNNVLNIKQPKRLGKIISIRKVWIPIAAAAVLVIISSLLLFTTPSTELIATPAKQQSVKTFRASIKSYSTTNEHLKVTLPDGSTVILNNHSTLYLTGNFNQERREVELIGEGYFDIRHDISKPFIVNSGKVRTTVLGTAFNVRAYPNSKIEVTVTRGKVSVLSGQSLLGILTPNRRIRVPHNELKSVVSTVIARNAIQWQAKDLFFDNISLDEAAVILSRKFNTSIVISDDKAKHCRFTATFLQGETLDEVLKVICSFNNAEYHKNADGILINGPGC